MTQTKEKMGQNIIAKNFPNVMTNRNLDSRWSRNIKQSKYTEAMLTQTVENQKERANLETHRREREP